MDPDRENCEGKYFQKIKMVKNKMETTQLSLNYDKELVKTLEYVIWMEMVLQQDSTKAISQRSSTQILDFLGDVGGFQGSLVIILYLFGEYFSSHLLAASIAGQFYKQKVTPKKSKGSGTFEGGVVEMTKL